MQHRYANILQPLKIGNVILKNRLIASKVVSMELQGPEGFLAESTMDFVSKLAKNGAAMVTCSVGVFPDKDKNYSGMSLFHMDDRDVRNYYAKMLDRIHAYGSLATASMMCALPNHLQISELHDTSRLTWRGEYGGPPYGGKPEISKAEIREFIDNFVQQCIVMKTVGFDACNIYMSYRGSILANSLSPVLNQRTDEYGGSLENRARLTKELFRAIKEACGQDFLIEAQISPIEEEPYGYTNEEFLDYCKMCEGLVDIFHLRGWDGATSHISPYNSSRHDPFALKYAKAFKERGIKAVVAPNGGFGNLDDIDFFIGSGQCDAVILGRPFIADPEYGKKLYEGRGEDVVPCIRCDRCHGAVCSVNPQNGLAHVYPNMFDEPGVPMKIAVVGGGPAGMQAAVTAAKRGHKVTLYEKNSYLGGQLHHADYMPFKWELKDFKDYLIRQMGKLDVDICLNTEATPDLISAGGFDGLIAACGAEPTRQGIPGCENKTVFAPVDVFGHEDALGQDIVVIGGALTGTETAIYLGQLGRNVTILTRQDRIAHDNTSHAKRAILELADSVETLTQITRATTTRISENAVYYRNADGVECSIPCDSVIFCSGHKPLVDECFRFAGLTPKYFVVGDANIHRNRHYSTFEIPKDKAREVEGDVRHAVFTGHMAACSL